MRKFWICLNLHTQPRESLPAFLFHFVFLFRKCTWNMLRPSNDDHQLSVRQVTQCSEGFDVTVRDSRVRHGIDLLRFSHQQMWDDLVICRIRPEHYKVTSSLTPVSQTLKYAAFWKIIQIAYKKPQIFYLQFSICRANSVRENSEQEVSHCSCDRMYSFLLCSTCLC